MNDGIGVSVCMLLVAVLFSFAYCTGKGVGREEGRCIERCRPERHVAVVTENECVCATKVLKLEKVP